VEDNLNPGIVRGSRSKFEKEEFIYIIKLVYSLNPDGKGEKRKRTLSEILSIIEDKSFKI